MVSKLKKTGSGSSSLQGLKQREVQRTKKKFPEPHPGEAAGASELPAPPQNCFGDIIFKYIHREMLYRQVLQVPKRK